MALPETQVPAVMHRRIGDVLISSIGDGFLDGSMAVLQNISVEESSQLLRDAFRPVPRRTAVNCFILRAGGRTALVDTGCGTRMAATGGQLMRNLAAAGIAPTEIDTILLTHMHPDHSNGLADEAGTPHYPNAELVTHAAEPAFWQDDAAMARAPEATRERNFLHARQQIAPYAARHRLFEGGEVFPGVTALPFPGHTPGHSGFLVSSGDTSLLIWGDIVHVPEVQVPRPEVTMTFDIDPAQAAATRRRVFDMVATDQLLVAGMHLHFPAFAHLVRDGAGHRLVPEPWSQTL